MKVNFLFLIEPEKPDDILTTALLYVNCRLWNHYSITLRKYSGIISKMLRSLIFIIAKKIIIHSLSRLPLFHFSSSNLSYMLNRKYHKTCYVIDTAHLEISQAIKKKTHYGKLDLNIVWNTS